MQQKVYPLEKHQLSLDQVDRDALYVMEKLRAAGFVAYLVGGSVRDLLLGKKPKDFDISTSAEPEEIRRLFRNCILIGRRFRLAHIRFGKKILEVSTFRAGATESTELVVRDNEWGTEEEDVMRRDFTINGLFYDPATQSIIDYVGGYADLQKRCLRTIGQPFVRFKQDPVRMLRLIKFVARFGLEIDEETRIALLECRHEILKSSPARILEEVLKMLESAAAAPFIKLLTEYGLLQLMLPALAEFIETKEGQEIYCFLEEVDTTFHEPPRPVLERPVLVGCLIWSMLQRGVGIHFEERGRHPHLGEIQQECHRLIDGVFNPFFLIPRKLRMSVTSILSAQYRLTPLDKRPPRRLRTLHDPDFPLALKFLEIRAALEPALQNTWEEWKGLQTTPPSELPPPRRRRRRRRRSRGGGGE